MVSKEKMICSSVEFSRKCMEISVESLYADIGA